MGASGSDQAVAAILKWAGREGWRERFDAVLADHPIGRIGELLPWDVARWPTSPASGSTSTR